LAEYLRIFQLHQSDSGTLTVAERQALMKFRFRRRCGLLPEDAPFVAETVTVESLPPMAAAVRPRGRRPRT
jgi:hypothetical protein